MHAIGADEDVARDCRSIMETCGHAVWMLLVFCERLAKTRVILQPRQEGLAEHASIDLAGDIPASLSVFEIEAEARQLSRARIEKHKSAGFVGAPRGRPDEIVIPLRQAGPQRIASRVIYRQAISLTADVAPGIAFEHRHGGAPCHQRVRETQTAQSSSHNDRARSSHVLASESLNVLSDVMRLNVPWGIFDF